MFKQLFPQCIDNAYRGHKLALWLFGVVVLVKLFQSLVSIFNGYSTLRAADGIPLDAFTPAGARTAVSLFAVLGLSGSIVCLICIVVLVRYRSMIPFMFALLLVEYLSRRVILHFLPVARLGTPPGSIVNLIILSLIVIGLVLSLRSHAGPIPNQSLQPTAGRSDV
jgi:hypothetical protein